MNYIAIPQALKPAFDAIPKELQALKAWTLWRYEQEGDKWKKPPCTTTGVNQRGPVATWELSTFDQVATAYLFGNFDGVGLVLQGQRNSQGLYLAALDFDDLTTPELRATALRIANEAGCTYVEHSPSGQGLRGWGWVGSDVGNKPKCYRHGMRFEVATTAKYFTVTGQPLPDLCTLGHMPGLVALVGDMTGRGGEEVDTYNHKGEITQQKIDDLKAPLTHLAAQGFGTSDDEWAQVRQRLQGGRELDGGKWEPQLMGLWLDYSRQIPRYCTETGQQLGHYDRPEDVAEAERAWRARGGDLAHPNGIFTLAQERGWVNPGRGTSGAGGEVAPLVLPSVLGWADVLTNPPLPVPNAWGNCTPQDEVTLLGAHGGTGKSTFALGLVLHVAAGRPYMGMPVRQGRAIYFSGEDGPRPLRYRLWAICQEFGFDPVTLERDAIVIDATDNPTLYQAHDGRAGVLTPSYQHLRNVVQRERPELVVIDNASDTYDASEIDRARVREFIRTLKKLSPCTAVVLAVHLSKASVTARGKDRNTEDYSGSTAWHNSARSRLSLSKNDATGVLTLTHQKANYGQLQLPLTMRFTDKGVLTHHVDPAHIGLSLAQIDSANKEVLLTLIEQAFGQGVFINPNKGGNCNDAHKVLSGKPGYPANLDRKQCLRLVAELEQSGDLMREQYSTSGRKTGNRWVVDRRAGVDPFDD